jgi:hypothetical protein
MTTTIATSYTRAALTLCAIRYGNRRDSQYVMEREPGISSSSSSSTALVLITAPSSIGVLPRRCLAVAAARHSHHASRRIK